MKDGKVVEYKIRLSELEKMRDQISEQIRILSEQRFPITKEINKIQYIISREEKRRNEK